MKKLCAAIAVVLLAVGLVFGQSEKKRTLLLLFDDSYLGRLSANPYAPDSTSNQFGIYGSPYSAKSVNNPYGTFGREAQNPYAIGSRSPTILGEDATDLGRLNRNQYDPESVANPYGPYGSPYSPNSINNPYGKYGSLYSPYSARNPYALEAPKLYAPKSSTTYSLPKLKSLWERQEP